MTHTDSTQTDKSPTSSISLAQLAVALQSLGISVAISPNKQQTQPIPSQPSVVSARISSPWVPTCVVPLAASAPNVAQSEQGGGVNVPVEATPSVTLAATPASPSSVSSAILEAPSGFVCQHCHQYTFLRPATNTWYAVTAGRSVGVYQGWHMVQSLVSGVPHASYRKYSSEAAAIAAFEDARDEGLVIVIN